MKPQRIILIRHGQSEGNVDKSTYATTPDFALHLTPEGHRQAEEAGEQIKKIVGNGSIHFYCSPFQRTKETLAGLRKTLVRPDGKDWPCVEEVRLREQEWGHLRDAEEVRRIQEERDAYHTFYYRIKDGESGADVYDRVASFFSTLFRDFDKSSFPENCVIVTHGYTLRIFLMKWFHYTVDEFVQLRNPKNCEFFVMERLMQPFVLDRKYTLLTPLGKKEDQ